MSDTRPESFVRNCIIMTKPDDAALFHDANGVVTAHLDGYAIIPIARYVELGGTLVGEPFEVDGSHV